jgi:DNA-binding response OmpR family regulator
MSESSRYELARRLADSLHATYGLLDARVWLRDGDTQDYLTIISPTVTQADQIIEATADELKARRPLGLGADLKGELGFVEVPGWQSMEEDRRKAIAARIDEAAQAMAAAAAISSATSESPRKIIVADEDAALRRSVRAVLHVAGFEVVEASDGRMAIEKVRAELPDLLLMAWLLPAVSGGDVARELKKDAATREIPIVIMVTAVATMDDRVEALDAGIQDFMFKPFDFRELLARIEMQVRWRKLLGHDVEPAASVSVAPKTSEESIGPELAHLNAILERKDFDAALKEAMSAAEFSEGRGEFEGAAQAYVLASQAADGARRPELANKLQRLAGTMYLRLAENSRDTAKIQLGYTMSARMFLMAGNLVLAEQAAEHAPSPAAGSNA